jgi:hypothetical protein|tara:strand:+ start:6077 stop:6580 length:504 start_codon:yes stop_codon:yes gene_type:complete
MPRFAFLFFTILFGALAGCSHYKLGTESDGDLTGRIFVAPVLNESEAPQIRALLTDQIRRQFSNHPNWRLASSRSDADYLLEVTVIEFSQAIAAVSSVDTGRAASYDLSISAAIVLTTSSGTVADQNTVEARTVLFAVPGQPETIYQAMPGLSQQLSEAIVREVTFH